MNIMYVSVLERTYEIGLRKAVGAKRKDILSQFMWEAIFMTLIGAVVGVIFGVGISYLVAVVANSQGFAWQFVILPSSLILACGVATAIGIIFGVFPARTASKMDAVEALRYNK
ncbi:MAG: FtsX-like permease family protein [Patescibacteria group bacterium]|nr:FtsX-like permease family protein [Patescibacteria group bacterium]